MILKTRNTTSSYVNSDKNLENLRLDDQTWKVRLIENDFHKLTFDLEDV